jgi:6,7-dimethyl-8-ribityllumazine synthase
MSTNFKVANTGEERPDGVGVRVAVVCARFNDLITGRLLQEGALDGLERLGVAGDDVTVAWVPGSFELPLAAKQLAASGAVDAVIAIGCVIRGDTDHYEHVATAATQGLQRAQLDTGVPVVFGVLTTENLEQSLVRSVPESEANDYEVDNKGFEAAVTALRMVTLLRELPG